MLRLIAAIVLCCNGPMLFAGDTPQGPAEGEVRQSVSRSLKFIEREGVAWIEKRDCVTCHQVPFMLWSMNKAHSRGFAIDETRLAEWNSWAVDWKSWSAPAGRPKAEEADSKSKNIDTMYQLLLAQLDYSDGASTSLSHTFPQALLKEQQADGSWKACGQLPFQNRPERETTEVTTMWTLFAIAKSASDVADFPAGRAKAEAWLKSSPPGTSTEWWAVQLLLADQLGNTEAAAEFRRELLAKQNENGGWGWLAKGDSDAFGTGLALYALLSTNRDAHEQTRAAIEQAQRFLLSTQNKNGSWPVHGTKKASAKRVTPTATYWGTCWAVIGLLESIPAETAVSED